MTGFSITNTNDLSATNATINYVISEGGKEEQGQLVLLEHRVLIQDLQDLLVQVVL